MSATNERTASPRRAKPEKVADSIRNLTIAQLDQLAAQLAGDDRRVAGMLADALIAAVNASNGAK